MKRWIIVLLLMISVSAFAQKPIRIYNTPSECEAATQLRDLLRKGGCQFSSSLKDSAQIIKVGLHRSEYEQYKTLVDSLQEDGYFIVGDENKVVMFGKGWKGTLYAVYAFLEMIGYRLYTPDAMVVPDVSRLQLPKCHVVSNPAFEYREVAYYYPNHSQLYADWHHLHTELDREGLFGMFVHTFGKLLPPEYCYDSHPEWYSLNNGRRSRDGQLCLSNPEVLEALCKRLADTMVLSPQKKIWSVSPNDNYNVCECANCRRLDSLYGGPSGTLLWFVNQVARRFPDKTIATLAYQYTRQAPTGNIMPDPNVLVMLCPIEAGRHAPLYKTDPGFRKDMEDWARLTNNIFLWDYVVQFRNFWDPFPNLHVLQPNLQYFRDHGTRMMFEQASGSDNITSWMDIRCYMLAKLLWNPDADMDSIMADFYRGYYGDAGRYVKEIIDTMTSALIQSGQRLDIYGFPVDAADSYLSADRLRLYSSLMSKAFSVRDNANDGQNRLLFFRLALDFANVELRAAGKIPITGKALKAWAGDMASQLQRQFQVPQMMEMGISPMSYYDEISRFVDKGMTERPLYPVTLRKPATAPYNTAGLTDGKAGIMDYRHNWLGFWGDTLDATIDLGEPTEIHEVSLDVYCYPLSWIFRPQIIEVYLSDDGLGWKKEGACCPPQIEELATPSIFGFTNKFPTSRTTRYVRVVAQPLPEIPAWHRAAGQKAWIFTDEIIVK
ncbi:MAG: DUF4838 domain-containing protein [Bacteroidales bacterium]|nr:DUF4838 domain-containing protein [Bacteroidales bacterium]